MSEFQVLSKRHGIFRRWLCQVTNLLEQSPS